MLPFPRLGSTSSLACRHSLESLPPDTGLQQPIFEKDRWPPDILLQFTYSLAFVIFGAMAQPINPASGPPTELCSPRELEHTPAFTSEVNTHPCKTYGEANDQALKPVSQSPAV
ncbi:hypothetical protein C8R43DRAFT_948094 [Mycena crocata]|nr:hypothetical protein C8R43DRAFT_948094 [Mycena crocata]